MDDAVPVGQTHRVELQLRPYVTDGQLIGRLHRPSDGTEVMVTWMDGLAKHSPAALVFLTADKVWLAVQEQKAFAHVHTFDPPLNMEDVNLAFQYTSKQVGTVVADSDPALIVLDDGVERPAIPLNAQYDSTPDRPGAIQTVKVAQPIPGEEFADAEECVISGQIKTLIKLHDGTQMPAHSIVFSRTTGRWAIVTEDRLHYYHLGDGGQTTHGDPYKVRCLEGNGMVRWNSEWRYEPSKLDESYPDQSPKEVEQKGDDSSPDGQLAPTHFLVSIVAILALAGLAYMLSGAKKEQLEHRI